LRFLILRYQGSSGVDIYLIFNEVLLPFGFKLLKQFLLLLSDMLGQLLCHLVNWEHGRLNTLVNIALSIRRR